MIPLSRRWALALFLSGFGALGYELLWSRYAALLLGSTAVAQVVVVAVFMGGLLLGQFWGGRRADIDPHPFRSFAFLQGFVSFWGLLYPFLYRGLDSLATSPARWTGLTASLLPPTVAMGFSLPLVIFPLLGSRQESDRSIGWLYGANNVGAVAGALVTSLYLLETFGLHRSLQGLAIFPFAAAALAFFHPPPSPLTPLPKKFKAKDMPLSPITLGGLVAITGFGAMACEVAFLRMATLLLGNSTYAFALILAAFIAGLSAGSFWVVRSWKAERDPLKLLRKNLVRTATVLLFFPLWPHFLPDIYLALARILGASADRFWMYQSLCFALVFVAALPITTFFGTVFPLASRLRLMSEDKAGESVGVLLALNAAGSLLGIAAGGLVLLPWLSISGVMWTVGLLCLALSYRGFSGRVLFLGMGYGLSLFALIRGWDRAALIQGPYRLLQSESPHESLAMIVGGQKVLYDRDGRHGTVTVLQTPETERILYIDGKPDASLRGDMPTQYLLADLPLLLAKPEPQRVLVIGYGSGMTAGAALQHPVREVVSVEISKEVMEASKHFEIANQKPLSDPRHRLVVGDAKTYLKQQGPQFDVIISEPSNPWMSSIASLFSKEQFQAAKKRLAPGGLMTQWFHVYQMSDPMFLTLMRTFLLEFPHVRVWNPLGNDILLIGSNQPIEPTWKDLKMRWQRPGVGDRLASFGLTSPYALLRLELAATPSLAQMVNRGLVYEDFWPTLEFEAARAAYAGSFSRLLWRWDFTNQPGLRESLLVNHFRVKPTRDEMEGAAYYMSRWWDEPGKPIFEQLNNQLNPR